MARAAEMSSGLLTKKGAAAPAVVADPVQAPAAVRGKAAAAPAYKALTVKLDRDRYTALKTLGVKLDKRSQTIFIEALDLWIQQAEKA
jgi:hypothetical protein